MGCISDYQRVLVQPKSYDSVPLSEIFHIFRGSKCTSKVQSNSAHFQEINLEYGLPRRPFNESLCMGVALYL